MSRALSRLSTILVSLAVVGATFSGGVAAVDTAGSGVQSATLTVTVVDSAGNPLEGAKLSATWEGGGPVNRTTAGNGKAFLTVAEGADVTIRVSHPHYVRNDPVTVTNATDGQNVKITLVQKGKATVTVRDDSGPVKNAIVRLFQEGHGLVVSGRTDDSGHFRTGTIEQGEYMLVAFKEGYLRNKSTVTVGANTSISTTIQTGSVLVSFRVTDDHFDDPRPIPNATITIGNYGSITTLADGENSISVPVNREYTVKVTKEGYGTTTRTLSVRESAKSMNLSIQRTPAITVDPANDRVVVNETVRVTVTDEYGEPVPNATVSLDGATVGETNANGIIDVPIDSAGNHTIAARAGDLRDTVVVTGIEPAPEETPTATPTESPTATNTTTTSGGGPGFGAAAAVVALLSLVVFTRRRG